MPSLLGLAIWVVPVPMDVPPHVPIYHFHEAPVPKVPPLNVRTLVSDKQNVLFVPLTLTAGAEVSLTVRVKDLQTVLLQVPSARR